MSERTATDAHPELVDTTAPVLTVNPISFDVGQSIDISERATDPCDSVWGFHDSIPMTLSWSATDAASGVQDFDVVSNLADEGNERVYLNTQDRSLGLNGGTYWSDCGGGTSNDVRWLVTARDNRGNVAISTYSGNQQVGVWQEDGTVNPTGGTIANGTLSLTKTAGWLTSNCKCYDAGSTLYSTKKGKSITYSVTPLNPGQTVAVVMEKNSNRGQVSISVNGGASATVNTYSAAAQHAAIVWQSTLPAGTSTIKVTNLGTSGRTRVDVDAVMLSDGPGGAPHFHYDSPE